MAHLLVFIPSEVLAALIPELKNVRDPLEVDQDTSRKVLLELSGDQEHFKRMLGIMIRNGLTTKALESCSKLKCKEWDLCIRNFFESMSFDSLWGTEEKFLPLKFEHSIIISIPLKSVQAEQLVSLKRIMERNEFDPLITRSMLLVIEKNYGPAIEDTSGAEISIADALRVFSDCRKVLLSVVKLEVRHFFNVDNFSATKNEKEEDETRTKGLDMDQLLVLAPIYVDKFEENNHPGMYADLLANLENVRGLYVDMLTRSFVAAMNMTGRTAKLEHALINKKDPRSCSDAVAVDMLLANAHKSLKLLQISNCFSTVATALEKEDSFPNLVELDVNQDVSRHCFELIKCASLSPSRVPLLSRLTLKNGALCGAAAPFAEFVSAALTLARTKTTLDALTLNLRMSNLPSHREAQELLKAFGTGCGKVKTLGFIIESDQIKQVGIILKAFVGIENFWVYIMTDNDAFVRNVVETGLLDSGKPRKLVWNLVPSLKCVKALNCHQRVVETWNR